MQIFDSYIEAGHAMSKRDREQYYTALIEYLFYGTEPRVTGVALAVITAIRPSLEESRARVVNGRKGGRPRKGQDPGNAETKTLETEKPNGTIPEKQNPGNAETQSPETEKANSKGKGNEKKRETNVSQKKNAETEKQRAEKPPSRFVPPTPAEVDAYIAERGYSGFNGEQFCAFYASKGWKVGNQPMRSWKQACVTWQYRNGGGAAPVPLDPGLAAYNFAVGGGDAP